MTPLNEDTAQQNSRNLGTHLGVLAAQNALPVASPRFSTILQSLNDQERAREQATAKFRAAHFILGD